MAHLGKALEKRRKELGLSLNKTARELDTTLNTYYTWIDEDRPSIPQEKNWDKIANFLERDRVDIVVLSGLLSDEELRAYGQRVTGPQRATRKSHDVPAMEDAVDRLAERLGRPVDIAKLKALCEHWKVSKLSLFGSVLTEEFSTDSDVDVLVDFDEQAAWSLMDLATFRDELGDVIGREVDLVEQTSIESSPNWIRRREILGTAEPILVNR